MAVMSIDKRLRFDRLAGSDAKALGSLAVLSFDSLVCLFFDK